MALLKSRLLRAAVRQSTAPSSTAAFLFASRHQFHTSLPVKAWKHDQDRNSLRPESAEYTLSGSDSELAEKDDAAWNPNLTDPDVEFAGTHKKPHKSQSKHAKKDAGEKPQKEQSSMEENARSSSLSSSYRATAAGAGSDTNPLEVSGANREVSRHTSEKEERTGDHPKSSCSKGGRKNGKVSAMPTKDTPFIGAGKQ